MAITHGSLSARIWRVTEPLPPEFREAFDRNIRRYAFRPVRTEKGETHSSGWVNARQVLDPNLSLEKALVGNTIILGHRIDRVTINARAFKARLWQETAKAERAAKPQGLKSEERDALKEKLKLEMVAAQTPSMTVHEIAWRLDSGLVFFGAPGAKANENLSDLFTQTFGVSIEPQLPFVRAERWAKRQKAERELREVLPSPFSPDAPAEVVMTGAMESEG